MRPQSKVLRSDLALLGVAVLAVSSAAILIRWADATALSLSFWRTLGGAVVLAPGARRSWSAIERRHLGPILFAGICLAAHFWLWLASLTMTTVAASTTLVSTVPLFVGGYLAVVGRQRLGQRAWLAIIAAVLGSAIIAGGDLGLSGDQALGDGLALAGAAAMAGYLIAGERLRIDLSGTTYSCATYGVSAVALALAALVTDTALIGYNAKTWVVIVALIIGPQLLGHTLLNHLLSKLGSLPISMSLLLEPIGAGVLAWALLSEAPPTTVWIGAPLVVAGVAAKLWAR